MAIVTLQIFGADVDLRARSVRGTERLGESSSFEIEAVSPDAIVPADVVDKTCALTIADGESFRSIRGTVVRFTAVAAGRAAVMRRFKIHVRSGLALLELRKRTRIHQHKTAPDIVKATLEEAGWAPDAIELSIQGSHAEREYVTQYTETDAHFIRRICEEDGLYFTFRAGEDKEIFVLSDTSTSAPAPLSSPLSLVDDAKLQVSGLVAHDVAVRRRARTGKVTLRDYDPEKPAVLLEGVEQKGKDIEKTLEVYAAPGRFKDPRAGADRAKLHLEGLRADAATLELSTNAFALAPGDGFSLEASPGYTLRPRPEGDFVAVAATHDWHIEHPEGYRFRIEALSKDTPFRLPRLTPRPRIAGVHTAVITGDPGMEIDPDKNGCVFLRFPWDREGASGRGTSLPVRVAQQNVGESMLIPRVGWEVFVAFEDSDPDRPFVIGRAFNAKTPPPFALPANKTVSSLATFSSPGGGDKNSIHFDDAAGRQHMSIHASFGKSNTVANNMVTQTTKVETQSIKVDQTRTVGASEDVSVKQAYINHAASQSATVGGSQNIYVKGNFSVAVDSESVLIGGALLEKVGNPVQGAINLGVSAALAGVGAVGGMLGPVGSVVGTVAATAGGTAWGAYQAANAPGAGPNAGRNAVFSSLLGTAAGFVPGGDAALATVQSFGVKMPWDDPAPPAGSAAAGGGAGGAASDSAAAAGPGPGHRDTKVGGAMSETIGGAQAVLTPGSIKWQHTGATVHAVGGSRSLKAVNVGISCMGVSSDTLGSFHITTAKDIQRTAKGAVKTSIGGSLKSSAGAHHMITADSSVKIKVGGSLTMKGSHVTFVVGSTSVSASPGGVLIKAGTITITGASKQSGETDHS